MIIEAILGIAGAIAAAYLWETKLRDRLTVRRIVGQDDDDIDGLYHLYEEHFPDDGTNYSPEDILELVVGPPAFQEVHHVAADNILLVAKHQRAVVGLLLCHFYPTARKAIVSYTAIDRNVAEARASAFRRMLGFLRRILRDRDHRCEFLFYDLQSAEPSTPPLEASERRARPYLFMQAARKLDLEAYELLFPYFCPKVALEHETREHPCRLVCVPLRGTLPNTLPREQVIEFLRFLHLDCYGDLYPVSDPRFQTYQSYLQERLAHYAATLPLHISTASTRQRSRSVVLGQG